MRAAGPIEREMAAFADRVFSMIHSGHPVRIYAGCGTSPAAGFINIDIAPMLRPEDTRFDDREYFFFPFAEVPWPIPEGCVDYIFHEDFIEHLSQKQQFCFLAETLRVLKAGSWHRVSTPCLIQSMRNHSHFQAGMRSVYTGEWDRWGHQALFTHHSLEEVAKLVGYREVLFNQKNQAVSPLRGIDTRPWDDRDILLGNIYADLLK
jgi:predicted SAM-dependent methyltransferase